MDIRRSINTKIWSDDWFETLKPNEKLIWFYLLTNPQTNMLGIYEVSIKRISFETGLKDAEISNALKDFERVKKAFYWFGWIVLPNLMKNQSLNTNMLTSASRLFDNLPNELKDKLLNNGFEGFESLLKGCPTLPKIEKEIESEIESGKGKLKVEIENEIFELWYSEYPRKEARQDALKAWNKLQKSMPELSVMVDKLKKQIRVHNWSKENMKYIPLPASYLNGRRWEDVIEDVKPVVLGINPFDMIPQ